MAKEIIDREIVIQNKKKAIRKLNSLLENFINSNDEEKLKKANLLSYWLQTFSCYIETEKAFSPKKLMAYKRGDIIRVNLGFRVGAELGGLHYAVVLDKENRHSADTITIIPLSSFKGKKPYERDLFLGSELYNLVVAQYTKQYNSVKSRLLEIMPVIDALKQIPEEKHTPEIVDLIIDLNNQVTELRKSVDSLERDKHEIERMKEGSIVKIEQITTISKMRIYTPKKSSDFLSGVRFSQKTMSRINTKLKEIYIFDE